jgi:hypothetical protein
MHFWANDDAIKLGQGVAGRAGQDGERQELTQVAGRWTAGWAQRSPARRVPCRFDVLHALLGERRRYQAGPRGCGPRWTRWRTPRADPSGGALDRRLGPAFACPASSVPVRRVFGDVRAIRPVCVGIVRCRAPDPLRTWDLSAYSTLSHCSSTRRRRIYPRYACVRPVTAGMGSLPGP